MLEALALTGEHQQCEELSTRAEALCRAAGNSHALGYVRYGQGVLALQQGRVDNAVTLLEEAHALIKGALHQTLVLIALGRALAQRKTPEDIEHAKAVFQESLSLLEQMGDTRKAGLVRAELTALD